MHESTASSTPDKTRILVIIDDGWRYEQRLLLQSLRRRLAVDVATHAPLTFDHLKEDGDVMLLESRPIRKHPLYALLFFFAQELDTHTIAVMADYRYRLATPAKRIALWLRRLLGSLGLRRYTYHDALKRLYRKSHRYDELLSQYDTLVYNPVIIQDKRIVYEAMNRGLNVIASVYSWDNPIKDNEFIPDADHYLVWNDACRSLIAELHGVPSSRMHITGPTPFEYLLHREESADTQHTDPAPYILFACSMGFFQFLIDQEIDLIIAVRRLMDRCAPDLTLLVRPYPFTGTRNPYRRLEGIPGIEIADFGQTRNGRIEISRKDLDEKIDQIERAACLVHTGSTIALEASYTDTPILQLGFAIPNALPDWQQLSRIYKNDHLKFITLDDYPNIVRDETQLQECLQDIAAGNTSRFMPYTRKMREMSRPLDVASYHETYIACLQELCGNSRDS